MTPYPRLLYRGAADATAQTCFVSSDAALDLALSQGWRRRRVPDVVIDPVPQTPPIPILDLSDAFITTVPEGPSITLPIDPPIVEPPPAPTKTRHKRR